MLKINSQNMAVECLPISVQQQCIARKFWVELRVVLDDGTERSSGLKVFHIQFGSDHGHAIENSDEQPPTVFGKPLTNSTVRPVPAAEQFTIHPGGSHGMIVDT